MRYEILGPIRLKQAGDFQFIRARKVEILLAILLVRRDQVVSSDQLVAEIWGDNPPMRANAALHVYISQLRKFLGKNQLPCGAAEVRSGKTAGPIVTRPLGYMLCTDTAEVDVCDFEQLMRDGRKSYVSGDLERAVDQLERALSLWRSPTLADLHVGSMLSSYATWLEECRLECIETLMAAYLNLQKHREVIGRLYALTSEYPMREDFLRYLMLALYRAGRRADALSVFRDARERHVNELGLEPSRNLQDLNCSILAAEECLDYLTI